MRPTVALSSISLGRWGDWSTSHLYGEADHPWKDRQPVKWTKHQQFIFVRLRPDGKQEMCFPTSFFSPLCSIMSWSNTAPNSSWIFCISLMWLATLFIAFMATAYRQWDVIELTMFWTTSNLITSSYRQGGNAPHCLGLWVSKAPLARGGTLVPSGWV